MLGLLSSVPLVEPSIDAMFVMGQPQFGDEAGKPDEEWGIEQTLAPEQLVAAPAHIAQSEAHHENGWIGRWRPADHGLSVHARRGAVGEAQPLSDMCARQAHLALSQ